jgi:outer membrane scaffolding protein for murein synthesis (MipA/OmpV family)
VVALSRCLSRSAVAAFVLSAFWTPALAADVAPQPAPVALPGWIVTVTANGVVGPRYPGSDEFSFIAFPSFSFRHVGEPKRFTTPDDGFSLPVYDTATLRAGFTGRFRGGRYLDDDWRLFGFKDVNWAVEPGLFVEFWPLEMLRLRAELRRGVNGHDGTVGDLGMDLVGRFGRFTASAGPRMALGDQEFMQTYFGVKPFEAAANGFVPAYFPSGGVASVGIATALSYDWSEQWSTTVSASYNRLVGDAADSPIVKQLGSENQFKFGASVSYSFSTAGW